MPETGLARGIKAIDCMLNVNLGGQAEESDQGMGPLLLRDPESRGAHSAIGYLFTGSAERTSRAQTAEEVLAMMDELGVEMALLSVSADRPDHTLNAIEKYPQRFFGKLVVNPHEGMEALRKIDAIARGNPAIKALSVYPFSVQKPPNDKIYYPIYVKAMELDLPVTITVGIPGPRVPGECQNPIYLDEPLWFFPELKIVMMHGGEPWQFTCVKLMLKWPNLYYMTSAFAPSRYPKEIVQYANTRGSDKVMYAGYYPAIPYERLKGDLQTLELRDHVWPKFLRENAMRVFKLDLR